MTTAPRRRISTRRLRAGGEGNVGCVIWLVIIAAIALAMFKIIPVKIHSAQLADYAGEQAQYAGRRDTSESIKKRILQRAEELDLPVDAKAIKVSKGKKAVRIEMTYTVPLEFPGYTYEWEFNEEIDRQIFQF